MRWCENCRFKGSDMRDAGVRGVIVRGAGIGGTDVRDAGLRGAVIGGAGVGGTGVRDATVRRADDRCNYERSRCKRN